jgi:hypothetical protein
MLTDGPGDDQELVQRLRHVGLQDGRLLLLHHLRRDGADPGRVAQALLQQPQAQLRAHGLLAARLAGRADLVLRSLNDPGVGKQAADFICQVTGHTRYCCFCQAELPA